jgi:hypothetical protein
LVGLSPDPIISGFFPFRRGRIGRAAAGDDCLPAMADKFRAGPKDAGAYTQVASIGGGPISPGSI